MVAEALAVDSDTGGRRSPVIFARGHHDPGSLHAHANVRQGEGEGVGELHARHHLLAHSAPAGHLQRPPA